MILHQRQVSFRSFISKIGMSRSFETLNRVVEFGYSSNLGGVEVFIKNIVFNTDVPIDLVVTTQDKIPYEDELINKGCRIFRIPSRRSDPMKYKSNISDIFKSHKDIRVAHVHLNSCSSIEAVEAASAAGVYTIAHSHSSNSNFGRGAKLLHSVNKLRLSGMADVKLACSQTAGEFLYGRSDFEIIKNGVDTEKFSFNQAYRDEIRAEFELGDRFVLCHVGMFAPVKNHSFIVDVFDSLLKKRPDSVLLLVGLGSEQNRIREKVEQLGISDKVIFVGRRTDVNKIMSASDAFLLPSFFEGFPIVLVEAQCAGLSCVVSDKVTREVSISERVTHLPLEDGSDVWADVLLSSSCGDRASASQQVADAGYDMHRSFKRIEEIYLEEL